MFGTYLEKDMRDPSRNFVPSDDDFINIKEGDTVEVIFQNDDHQVEKLAVKVKKTETDSKPYTYFGVVQSKPLVLESPIQGEKIAFGSKHISNIYPRD